MPASACSLVSAPGTSAGTGPRQTRPPVGYWVASEAHHRGLPLPALRHRMTERALARRSAMTGRRCPTPRPEAFRLRRPACSSASAQRQNGRWPHGGVPVATVPGLEDARVMFTIVGLPASPVIAPMTVTRLWLCSGRRRPGNFASSCYRLLPGPTQDHLSSHHSHSSNPPHPSLSACMA